MRPWNPGYRSRKVIQIGMPTIRKFGCGFKFTFNSNYSNYGTILYCLRDIATYWSKIANFFISHLYLAPLPGWPRRNFASVFDIRKTRMLRLPLGEEITTMFIRSNRQTDGQTDRIAISISSDKNVTLFISQTLTNFYNIWNITYRVNFLQHNNSKYCCCTTSGKDNYIFQQDNVPPERAGSSYYQQETHSSGLMTSE